MPGSNSSNATMIAAGENVMQGLRSFGIASAGPVGAGLSVLFPAVEAAAFLGACRHERGFVPSSAKPEHMGRDN